MKNVFRKYKELIICIIIILIFFVIQICKINTKSDEKTENIIKNEIISNEEYTLEAEKACKQQGNRNFLKLGENAIFVNSFDECIYIFNLTNKSYKKLYHSEHGINKIYFDGEYIYLLPSYFREKGIYKIDLLGNAKKIHEGGVLQLWLEGNKIYFVDQIGYDQINGTPQGNLCVIDKEGNYKSVLIENVKNAFYIYENYIYYTDQNSRSIYKANIDGTNKVEIAEGRTYITSVNKNFLTFTDYNDREKHKILFFSNNEIISVGCFGNIFETVNGVYFYTRKIIDENNLEEGYTLYYLGVNDNSVKEIWSSDAFPLASLIYKSNNNCYIQVGSEIYEVDINNEENMKKIEDSYKTYFIDDKAYTIKSFENEIHGLKIYNLKNKDIQEF